MTMFRFSPARAAVLLLALAVPVTGLFLAACGGDDASATPPSATSTTAATSASSGRSSTPASTATGVLGDLQKSMFRLTYKIAYDMTTTPASGSPIAGTLTLGSLPPTTLIGLKGAFAGANGNYILIDDGTSSYTCIEAQGQKQCLKGKSGGGNNQSPIDILSVQRLVDRVAADPSATTKPIDGQTIAGINTNCYDIQSASGNGTACIAANEGVLLSLDGTFSGMKVTMKATGVNLNPTADDFKPPYSVIELAGR